MALPIGLKPGLKAKTVINDNDEYAATCLAHAVVYRLNGKAVKTDKVPEEVKAQLHATMLVGGGTPTDVRQVERPIVESTAPYEPSVLESVSPSELAGVAEILDEVNQPVDELGFSGDDAPQIDYEAMLQEAEARSVDAVNLRVLVKALYERFGVYTVYLNKTPSREDINPLTGAIMNTLTLGQANQGFRVAQRTGTSWNPEAIKGQIEAARRSRTSDVAPLPQSSMAAAQTVEDAPFGREIEMPSLHGEPMQHPERRYNRSYESPHSSAMYPERGKESDGTDPDEVYAEPPINARTAIVRQFKSNKRSEDQLQRISQRRVVPTTPVNFDDLV